MTGSVPTIWQRALSVLGAVLLGLYASVALAGGVAPFYGGLDYNPEFDGLITPFGLIAAYGSLYCLRRAFPRLPWIGRPSLDQGCLFSWLGFAVVGVVFETLGAIRGNRAFDPGGMLFFGGIVLLPLALFWIVRRAAAAIRTRA